VPKENNNHTYEDREPSTLFREFAAECMESAQTTPTPDKRALYLKMASVWHQMAQRWEKKGLPGATVGS
jgi:acid phosphatase class B